MTSRVILKGKVTGLIAICAAILGSSSNATAITSGLSPSRSTTVAIGHKHEFGQTLAGMVAEHIRQPEKSFGPVAGPDTFALTGTARRIDFGTQNTYVYAVAKYVADFSALAIIPVSLGKPGAPGGGSFTSAGTVPDGGVTAMMLGVALGLLGLVRRCLVN